MTNNTNCTKYYSNKQETSVAITINGYVQPGSGCTHFKKGDVINKTASLLCECKTTTSNKESFTIKKEWITKNRDESFSQRLTNQCIAFSFGPDQPNYFVINEKLMKYLVSCLEKDCE